jgi:hypothetical protein
LRIAYGGIGIECSTYSPVPRHQAISLGMDPKSFEEKIKKEQFKTGKFGNRKSTKSDLLAA